MMLLPTLVGLRFRRFRTETHFQIETRLQIETHFRTEAHFRTEVEAAGAVDVDSEEGGAVDQTLEEVMGTTTEVFHRLVGIGIGMVEI